MKNILICILIIGVSFINIEKTSYFNVYAETSLKQVEPCEQKYLNELENIKNQLDILSSNAITAISNKSDTQKILKDANFLKTQIRELRIKLSDYHKTQSGNIEKNPLSLALLNALNYYSMALSYIMNYLISESISDKNSYLENYYFSKAYGDQTLNWLKTQIK